MEQGTRLYSRSHEWIEALEDGIYRVGVTAYAQDSMGDIVYVDLPDEGDDMTEGEAFAEAESVKAVSEIFSPVTGVVTAVNEDLDDNPGAINEDPYEAWLVEVEADTLGDDLMDEDAYEDYLQTLD